MSVKVTALCWQVPLPVTEKLVLLRLADYADADGGSIYPAVATIAHDCGLSPRAVQYILKRFVDDGLLVLLSNATGGRGKTRRYAIDLDRAGQKAGPDRPGGQEPERVQRVQDDCTLSSLNGSGKRVQRVQNSALKGAVDLHPTHQESVNKKESPPAPDFDSNPACTRTESLAGAVGGLTGIPSTARNREIAAAWLRQGWSAELDILPAIGEHVRTMTFPLEQVRGFGFFTDTIEAYRARRLNPLPARPGNVLPMRPGREIEAGAAEFLRRAAEAKARMGLG